MECPPALRPKRAAQTAAQGFAPADTPTNTANQKKGDTSNEVRKGTFLKRFDIRKKKIRKKKIRKKKIRKKKIPQERGPGAPPLMFIVVSNSTAIPNLLFPQSSTRTTRATYSQLIGSCADVNGNVTNTRIPA